MNAKATLSGFGLAKITESISNQYVGLMILVPKTGITAKERQLAIEYVQRPDGYHRIILCLIQKRINDSDIREFSFDIGILSPVKELSRLVEIPAKVDRLMIEVHLNPTVDLSAIAQPLTMKDFSAIIGNLKSLASCSCQGRKA